eukprot:3232387-Heterocapsa_arctica.AAC.1
MNHKHTHNNNHKTIIGVQLIPTLINSRGRGDTTTGEGEGEPEVQRRNSNNVGTALSHGGRSSIRGEKKQKRRRRHT